MSCGVPQAVAPELVGWTDEELPSCYWNRRAECGGGWAGIGIIQERGKKQIPPPLAKRRERVRDYSRGVGVTAQGQGTRRICVNSELALFSRRGLRAQRLGPTEGIEIRPDMLHALFVESLDGGIAALRGIDLQLYLAAGGIHGVRRIQVHAFVGGILHF